MLIAWLALCHGGREVILLVGGRKPEVFCVCECENSSLMAEAL